MGLAFSFAFFAFPCSSGTGWTSFLGLTCVQSGLAMPFFAIFHHLSIQFLRLSGVSETHLKFILRNELLPIHGKGVRFPERRISAVRQCRFRLAFQLRNQFSYGDNFFDPVCVAAYKNQTLIHISIDRIDQCL